MDHWLKNMYSCIYLELLKKASYFSHGGGGLLLADISGRMKICGKKKYKMNWGLQIRVFFLNLLYTAANSNEGW